MNNYGTAIADRLRLVVRRLMRTSVKELAALLIPTRVDQYLFEMSDARLSEFESSNAEPPTPLGFEITRHDPTSPCGIPDYDSLLSAQRILYLAHIDGRVAHRSSLLSDVVFPGRFGYPDAPVIGGCFTDDAFRGQGIYPKMIRHIAHETLRLPQHDRVYVLVAADNAPSIRGIEKAGFERVARLSGWRVAGMLLARKARQPE